MPLAKLLHFLYVRQKLLQPAELRRDLELEYSNASLLSNPTRPQTNPARPGAVDGFGIGLLLA